MRRQRAQVLIIFAVGLLPLLGFLGLAVDGMYYFIALRGVHTAVGIAARTAAMDVQEAQASLLHVAAFARATPDAQAMGQQNLSQFRLTNVSFDVSYNNTINALILSLGWSSATPTAFTNSVKVTASGTYNTVFLRLLGISTVDIGQSELAKVAIVSVPRALPFGVCKADYDANNSGSPKWTIWKSGGISASDSLCQASMPAGWEGFLNLDGTASGCLSYQSWVTPPPPTGPSPPNGWSVDMDTPKLIGLLGVTVRCPVDVWVATYLTSQPYRVPVYNVVGGRAQIAGCLLASIIHTTLGKVEAGLDVHTTSETLQPCAPQQVQ